MIKIAVNLGTANDFNVFILGNDTQSNTDSEGRVAIAGNAVLVNYGVGDKLPMSTTRADLVVGGTLDASGGENFNGNTVISSLSNVVRYTMTNGNGVPGQPLEGSPVDFEAEANYLHCISEGWAALSPNGAAVVEYGGLTLIGNNPDLNIFEFDAGNVTGSGIAMSGLNKIDIVAPAGSVILINVRGTAAGFGSYSIFRNGEAASGADGQKIMWNMPDVTSLSANTTSIKGSLLAPNATYTSGYSNIEGTLIVDTLTGNVEAHDFPFTGSLPDTGCGSPTPADCVYRQAVTDIIESVALEQTALSHILNAEGEKIQKAVAMDTDTAALLDVNQSVVSMVKTLTKLEQLLLRKVETAKDICK